eukprot:TRINITY_DN12250_c0_g1_i1.p1 TRINITY_DN12250_c0_g1~~TRINITY_DN12250_c0_g1_i1.p1  ORF type:complete len:811 (-),score=233.10 TRINITY_DN12250_c0_g1_i1:35-2467(-)
METEDELRLLSSKELVVRILDCYQKKKDQELDDAVSWLLYEYSPEEDFEIHHDNAESLKNEALLQLFSTKLIPIYESDIILETINLFAALEGFELEVAKTNVVKTVLNIMDNDKANRYQMLACKILGCLATNYSIRVWLGKFRVLNRIINALKLNGSVELIICCCNTLVNLFYKCPENQNNFLHLKGVETIVEILSSNKGHTKCVHACLRVLRNVSSAVELMELQQHLITREVIVTMSDTRHNVLPAIHVHSIWILINLMKSRVPLKEHMINGGVVEALVNSMEAHSLDKDVELASATCLGLLLKCSESRLKLFRHRGVPAIISGMKEHKLDEKIIRAFLKVIFRFSFNQFIRDKIACEITPEILKAMKNHPNSGPLQRSSCLCLIQLSKNPQCKEIVHHEGLSLMIQTMNRFQNLSKSVPLGEKRYEHVVGVARKGVDLFLAEGAGAVKKEPGEAPRAGVEKAHRALERKRTGEWGEGEKFEELGEVSFLKKKLEEKNVQIELLEVQVKKMDLKLRQLKIAQKAVKEKRKNSLTSEEVEEGLNSSRGRATSSDTPKDKLKGHGRLSSSKTPGESPKAPKAEQVVVVSPKVHSKGKVTSPRRTEGKSPRKRKKEEKGEEGDGMRSRAASDSQGTRKIPEREKKEIGSKTLQTNLDLAKENEKLKLEMKAQAELLEEEIKKKKRLQNKLLNTQKNVRNSQRLVYDLQKCTLSSSEEPKHLKKIKRMKKTISALEKENQSLKKLLESHNISLPALPLPSTKSPNKTSSEALPTFHDDISKSKDTARSRTNSNSKLKIETKSRNHQPKDPKKT